MKNFFKLFSSVSVLTIAPVAMISCGGNTSSNETNIPFNDAKVNCQLVSSNVSNNNICNVTLKFTVNSSSKFRFPNQKTFPGTITNIKQGNTNLSINEKQTKFVYENNGLNATAYFSFENVKSNEKITFDINLKGIENPKNQNCTFKVVVSSPQNSNPQQPQPQPNPEQPQPQPEQPQGSATHIKLKSEVRASDLGVDNYTTKEFAWDFFISPEWVFQHKEVFFDNCVGLEQKNISVVESHPSMTPNNFEIYIVISNNVPEGRQMVTITGFKPQPQPQPEPEPQPQPQPQPQPEQPQGPATHIKLKSEVRASDLGVDNYTTKEFAWDFFISPEWVFQHKEVFFDNCVGLEQKNISVVESHPSMTPNNFEIYIVISNNVPEGRQMVTITGFKPMPQ